MASFTSSFFALAFLVTVSNTAPNPEINMKLPEECKGKGFCNIKPEGYDEMLDLIDSLPTPAFLEATQKSMEDRFGSDFSHQEDWHNCPYLNQTESPYFYSDSDDSDFDLIIQNSKLLQPIQTITCAYEKIEPFNTTEQCFGSVGLSSFNLASRCETLTANRTFTVFDKKLKHIVTKSYPVNCSCSCIFYKPDEIMNNKID